MVVYWNEEMWERNKEAEWWMGVLSNIPGQGQGLVARDQEWMLRMLVQLVRLS